MIMQFLLLSADTRTVCTLRNTLAKSLAPTLPPTADLADVLNGSKTHSVPLSTHAAAHHLHAAQHAGLSRLGRRFR
ncbi:MAG: hypothetical protein EBV69_06555 [Oxalobacteraceae bacterium]|nr:hypothetical protein [Oxalobacteraceae bacterium]NDG06094.1 hypothetical protein [Oxalobacteraceae bacterium]